MSKGYKKNRYKSTRGILVTEPSRVAHIGDLSRFGITDFKDLPEGFYPADNCEGCGAKSYTRKETHFECDYCGNKYGEV